MRGLSAHSKKLAAGTAMERRYTDWPLRSKELDE